jgi:hypothetical protein
MMMMDIKNFFLGTLLPRFEYMKMLLSRFPEEIVQKYNLNALAVDGWVNYIRLGQSRSLSSWTISQLSTWASTMQSISGTPFCELMN